MKTANPTQLAQRRYLAGFTIGMVAYVAVLFAAMSLVNHYQPQGLLRYLLLLVPLVPVAFVFAIAVRFYRDTDEFEQRIMTESLAIAAVVTAALSVTYGFLENTGLPRLSAWWTWAVVMGSWL